MGSDRTIAAIDLDIEHPEALIDYLRRTRRVAADEAVVCRTLAGGVSNRTVHVALADGRAWVIKQALAKLRVQADWFSDPARVHREARGLRWLNELIPGHVPGFVFEDEQQHLLAMQAAPQPHENWKTMLLRGDVYEAHVEQFGRLLGRIHREAFAMRDAAAVAFGDRRFFESLRLEPYYGYSAERLAAGGDRADHAAAFLHALIDETRGRRLTLVHGDYSPKNILVHDDELILLDHEVIHFGDPAFDLGFALTHLLSKAHHLRGHRAEFADSALHLWNAYIDELGRPPWFDTLEPMAARHTLGCLLARIVGRSPLEYLDDDERAVQRAVVVAMMRDDAVTVRQVVEAFVEGVG